MQKAREGAGPRQVQTLNRDRGVARGRDWAPATRCHPLHFHFLSPLCGRETVPQAVGMGDEGGGEGKGEAGLVDLPRQSCLHSAATNQLTDRRGQEGAGTDPVACGTSALSKAVLPSAPPPAPFSSSSPVSRGASALELPSGFSKCPRYSQLPSPSIRPGSRTPRTFARWKQFAH